MDSIGFVLGECFCLILFGHFLALLVLCLFCDFVCVHTHAFVCVLKREQQSLKLGKEENGKTWE